MCLCRQVILDSRLQLTGEPPTAPIHFSPAMFTGPTAQKGLTGRSRTSEQRHWKTASGAAAAFVYLFLHFGGNKQQDRYCDRD